MTAASTAQSHPDARGVSGEIDTSAGCRFSLLIGWALVWLIVSGILALITTIQLVSPSFLASCSALTHGRAEAIRESAFVYGWAANAGFAVATWILSRLGGAPLRGLGLMTAGVVFWNLGLAIGLVAIGVGEATSIPLLQMPAFVHPLLLVAFAAIATPGILAWTGRRTQATYAAQWYAVAALFLFPWFYSASQVLLLGSPVRGVAQAVVAGWFAQNVVTLWLLPIALAAAYYIVPKLTAQPAGNYDYARHGFWVLIAFGGWTGARNLVGGPVPSWIPTLAIVTTTLLLFHNLIVYLNLRGGLRNSGGNVPLEFVKFGLLAYLLSGVGCAVFSYQELAEVVQFTYFPMGQLTFLLTGAFSFLIFGALYEMTPRFTGIAWPSAGLVRAHFGLAFLGSVIASVGFAAAGWVQGKGMLAVGMTYSEIAASTRTWLLVAAAGEAALLLSALVFTLHFARVQASSLLSSSDRNLSAAGAAAP